MRFSDVGHGGDATMPPIATVPTVPSRAGLRYWSYGALASRAALVSSARVRVKEAEWSSGGFKRRHVTTWWSCLGTGQRTQGHRTLGIVQLDELRELRCQNRPFIWRDRTLEQPIFEDWRLLQHWLVLFVCAT